MAAKRATSRSPAPAARSTDMTQDLASLISMLLFGGGFAMLLGGLFT